MTDYYVRTPANGGSDAAAGTTPATAWATIDKAANTVIAGDTVYIGAGIYRELVTMDTSGTSGNQITFEADIDGSQTGDGGLVIVSAYDNDTDSAAVRLHSLNFQDKEFITWRNVIFNGGTSDTVDGSPTSTNLSFEEVLFEGCVFIPSQFNNTGVDFDFNDGASPTTNGLRFVSCNFLCGLMLRFTGNEVADIDLKCTIENCFFSFGSRGANTRAIYFLRESSGTFYPAGITIRSCMFFAMNIGVLVNNLGTTTNTVDVRGCSFLMCEDALQRNLGAADSLTSDYNYFAANDDPYTNVSAGANDEVGGSYALISPFADLPLYRVNGWSPFKPLEAISMSDYTSPLIGGGDPSNFASEDIYRNPRPMGRGNTADANVVESRIRPHENTTDERTGTSCAEFAGAGFYEVFRPVAASFTTVSVYTKFDANYTGNKPKIEVFNIPGVADQSDVATGSAGSYEELTVSFTPTSSGWVRIRLSSEDTSATGLCFFDDLTTS